MKESENKIGSVVDKISFVSGFQKKQMVVLMLTAMMGFFLGFLSFVMTFLLFVRWIPR